MQGLFLLVLKSKPAQSSVSHDMTDRLLAHRPTRTATSNSEALQALLSAQVQLHAMLSSQ